MHVVLVPGYADLVHAETDVDEKHDYYGQPVVELREDNA